MYRISELAREVGLSRSTLLYYEKLGLIKGQRQLNGYRVYTNGDLQRLKLLLQLQAGGLSLKESLACLDAKVDRQLLEERLATLETEIAQKVQAKVLLSSLLGMDSMRSWHQAMDKQAPDAHFDWLLKQGFTEKQALKLKWLSQDMNVHDQYIGEFDAVFNGLERLGPGSAADTLRAWGKLPDSNGAVLEIGCGKGISTQVLAHHTRGSILAIDNDELTLCVAKLNLAAQRLSEPVRFVCASMTQLPFDSAKFDVVWAEGSAYIMGVEKALKYWRRFLKSTGFIVFSDLVWFTDEPSTKAKMYWSTQYPDMQTVAYRIEQIKRLDFEIIDHFSLSQEAWDNYLQPLNAKLMEHATGTIDTTVLSDLKDEIDIHDNYLGEYGYQFFITKLKR